MAVYYVCGKCRTPVIYSPAYGETDTHECPKVELPPPLTPTFVGVAAGLVFGAALVVIVYSVTLVGLVWVLG